MQLEFIIQGQELKRTDGHFVIANSKGYLKAHFKLPTDYSGTISAYFQRYNNGIWTGTPVTVDKATGLCDVPDDCITDGTLYVGLQSTDTNITIPTNHWKVAIGKSGVPTDTLPSPSGNPNDYTDFVLKHQEVIAKTDIAVASATDAELSEAYAYNSEINAKSSELSAEQFNTTAEQQATASATKAAEALHSAEDAEASRLLAEQAKADTEAIAQGKLGINDTSNSVTEVLSSSKVNSLLAQIETEFDQAVGAVTADSEVVLSRNSAVKEKTFATLDGRLEDLDADTYLPMTNLIINGDFSNGTTGWTGQGLSIPNTVGTSSSITATATATAVGSLVMRQTRTLALGSKYYMYVDLEKTFAATVTLYGDAYITLASFVANKSAVLTGDGTAYITLGTTMNVNIGEYMRLKKVLLLNLTAIFGAGNEPTHSQMDKLLSQYSNSYFNGTVNLAKGSKLLPYLIKQVSDLDADSYFPATNLITNGDFSNGTTGWSLALNIQVTVTSQEAILLATQQYSQITQSKTTIVGNKYYIKANIKSTSNQVVLRVINDFSCSGSGVYETITGIVTATATTSNFVIFDNRTSGWDNICVDNLAMINLTATFGAGNEPSKSEMDRIMAYYPNSWFNGAVNLAQNSKMLKFLLNEIRSKAAITQEAWTTPTLLNGVVAVSPVGYYKNTLSEIKLKGRLSGVSTGTNIINLPVGYRPLVDKSFPIITTSNSIVRLYISSAGALQVAGTISGDIYLDGVSFKAEQ